MHYVNLFTFYIQVNIFLGSLFKIFEILHKNWALLRKNLFRSIGPWTGFGESRKTVVGNLAPGHVGA